MKSEIEALKIRLAQLERGNRLLKLIGLGVVLGSAALNSTGFFEFSFSIGREC